MKSRSRDFKRGGLWDGRMMWYGGETGGRGGAHIGKVAGGVAAAAHLAWRVRQGAAHPPWALKYRS